MQPASSSLSNSSTLLSDAQLMESDLSGAAMWVIQPILKPPSDIIHPFLPVNAGDTLPYRFPNDYLYAKPASSLAQMAHINASKARW